MASLFNFLVLLVIILLYSTCSGSDEIKDCSFKAAVFEHLSYTSLATNASKEEATYIMQLNLNVYEEQVKKAAAKGAKVIVFPEYGITGFFLGGREDIVSYLQYIPELGSKVINPCLDGGYQLVPKMLSCLARDHNIIIVADFATYKPCTPATDPSCPSDNRYQYNTAVAFGSNGAILTKYNKINLYSGEKDTFNPGEDSKHNLGFFKTDFGVFGIFICFDILYNSPATTYMQIGVDTFIFPTGWMNELPLLSAIEYQQAYALGHKINLLGANQHLPFADMTGSAVISGVDGAGSYYHDTKSYSGKLIVAELPCYPKQILNRTHKDHGINSEIDLVNKERFFEGKQNLPSVEMRKKVKWERNVKDLQMREVKISKLISRESGSSYVKDNDTFVSRMNNDPTTFKLLLDHEGTIIVSDNSITCTLKYSIKKSSLFDEWYALGAFSGLHTRNGQYYVQTCALIKCKDKVKTDCGAQTSSADTIFASFDLRISGHNDHTFLTPEVLTTGVNLLPKGKWWKTSEAVDNIWSDNGIDQPLLMTGIYGRLYASD